MMMIVMMMLLGIHFPLAVSLGFAAVPLHTTIIRDVAVLHRRGMTTMGMTTNASGRSPGGANSNPVGKNLNSFQRVLLAAAAMPFLAHEEDLPPPARRLISNRARMILAFVTEYLADRRVAADGWDADLYASGGYVRDLLLGRISPDLDLSLGLSRCPPGVTVETVATGMNAFCRLRPDLAVESVDVMSRRSGAAERKGVDAVQVRLGMGGGEMVYVDLLPTIGTETYGPGDRIPHRDVRGSAEEDSLRRDLTIGSMLLEVTREQQRQAETNDGGGKGLLASAVLLERVRQKAETAVRGNIISSAQVGTESSRNGSNRSVNATGNNNTNDAEAVSLSAAVKAASNLRFVLLDYHGGIEDLSTRTLRCPVPRNATLPEIWDQAIQSPEDENLAHSLGLSPDNGQAGPNSYRYDDATKIRALWWAKIMKEDPYRLLRTLRFAITLDFRIDPSFWSGVPFALRPGAFEAKVSHTRKVDELRKVATGAGVCGVVKFLGTVLRPPIGGSALRDAFFAVPLLTDGNDMGVVDGNEAQRLAAQLPQGLSVDARVGAALVAALFSCESDNNSEGENKILVGERESSYSTKYGSDRCGGAVTARYETPISSSAGATDTTLTSSLAHGPAVITTRLDRTIHLVEAACDGLLAPTSIRRAAIDPLSIARRLLEPLPVLGMHLVFARAVDWPSPSVPVSMEERARQFATMVRGWDLLQLDPSSSRRRPSSPDPRWVLTLLAAAADDGSSSGSPSGETALETARRLQADVRLLLSSDLGEGRQGAVVGPQPRGGAPLGGLVAGLPEVPPHLRGQMMAAMHVLTRLRGDAPTIETPDQLRTYLQTDCDGLLTKLTDEWWVTGEGGMVKEKDGGDKREVGWLGIKLRPPYVK